MIKQKLKNGQVFQVAEKNKGIDMDEIRKMISLIDPNNEVFSKTRDVINEPKVKEEKTSKERGKVKIVSTKKMNKF